MVDLKGLAEEASHKAALAAGKDMARRALEDLTLSAEEKQRREQERTRARQKTLLKLVAVGAVGLVVVLSVMSLLAKLWMFAIGALVVAGVGAGAYFALKPRLAAWRSRATARLEQKKRAQEAEQLRLEAAAQEKARVDAERARQQKLEDELAALKRKAGG